MYDISTIKEFEGMSVIDNVDDLKGFLGKLRQDWYSPTDLEELNLESELENWLKLSSPDRPTFFAVEDEKDDLMKNDNWGSYRLFRAIVVKTQDGKTHSFKSLVKQFSH